MANINENTLRLLRLAITHKLQGTHLTRAESETLRKVKAAFIKADKNIEKAFSKLGFRPGQISQPVLAIVEQGLIRLTK